MSLSSCHYHFKWLGAVTTQISRQESWSQSAYEYLYRIHKTPYHILQAWYFSKIKTLDFPFLRSLKKKIFVMLYQLITLVFYILVFHMTLSKVTAVLILSANTPQKGNRHKTN